MIARHLTQRGISRRARAVAVLAGAVLLAGCAATQATIPDPRPIINFSGARLRVHKERMQAVNEWVLREQDNIERDPGFWVITDMAAGEVYPWDGLRFAGSDSVRLRAAGTHVALETADIALVGDDLSRLPFVVRLGRETIRTIRVNVAIALGLKAAFVALTLLGSATLGMAVLADTGASLIVVAYAMRLLSSSSSTN